MQTLSNLNKGRTTEKTQATRFLMPLVSKGSDGTYLEFIKKGIDNCYLYEEDKLILVYEHTDDNISLEEKMRGNSLFEDSIDIKNENKVGYIFNVPEQYKQDLENFKQGKYSEFSKDMKDTILSFWNLDPKDETNVLYAVLNKTEIGKDYAQDQKEDNDEFEGDEVWMKPNIEIEQFSNIYSKA